MSGGSRYPDDGKPKILKGEKMQMTLFWTREQVREELEKFFTGVLEWSDEYHQSDDYVGEYTYLIFEDGHRLMEAIRKRRPNLDSRVMDNLYDWIKDGDRLVSDICSEYSSTSRNYVDGFQIGEVEEQIDFRMIAEHFEREGFEIEDADLISEIELWVEDQREFCLRTYLDHANWPHMYLYNNTGLRVDFDLNDEDLDEGITEAIVKTCEQADSSREWKAVHKRMPEGLRDGPKLVRADWCDERGYPRVAEALRALQAEWDRWQAQRDDDN